MTLFCNPWRDNTSTSVSGKRRTRQAMLFCEDPEMDLPSWDDVKYVAGSSVSVPEMVRASSTSSVSSEASTASTSSSSSTSDSTRSPLPSSASKRRIFSSLWVEDCFQDQRTQILPPSSTKTSVHCSSLRSTKTDTETESRESSIDVTYRCDSCDTGDSVDTSSEAVDVEDPSEKGPLSPKRRSLFPSFSSSTLSNEDCLPVLSSSSNKVYTRIQKAKSTSCIDGHSSPTKVMRSSLRCSNKWKGKERSKSHPNFRASVSFDPNVQVLEFRRCEVQYAPSGWSKMFSYS